MLILATFMIVGSAAAAQWEFNVPGEPYNVEMLSNNTNSIFLTDLETNEGEHLHPDNLGNGVLSNETDVQYLIYEIETKDGIVNETLDYHSGLEMWYAEFKPSYTGMDNVTFRARGETATGAKPDSQGEVNETFPVQVGDIDVDLLTEIRDPIRSEREKKIDVRTTNTTSDEIVDNPRPDLYFTNGTFQEAVFELENFNDDPTEGYNFNAEVQTPSQSNSSYVMRTVADEYEDYFGSYSEFVNTGPDIKGEFVEINGGDNCDSSSFAESCEPETDLDIDFGITAANAEWVNASLYGYNESGEHLFDEVEMNEVSVGQEFVEEEGESPKYNQMFDGNLTIPDINTSKYEDSLRVDIYAAESDRSYEDTEEIELETYRMEDRSNPTAFKDRAHEIRLRLGKYYSLSPYGLDRFEDIDIELYRGDFNESFTMSDLSFNDNDGVISTEVIIPSEEESGTYNIDVETVDKFGEHQEHSSSLTVSEVEASFQAEREKHLRYNKTDVYLETIELQNLVDQEKAIEPVVESEKEDIEEYVIIEDEDLILEPGEIHELEFGINYSEPIDFDADIVFQDTDIAYNDTTRLNVEGPNCPIWDGRLCTSTEEIETTVNSSEETYDFNLRNLHSEDIAVNFEFEGNVSDVVSAEDMNISDYETGELVTDLSSPDYYTGEMIANTTNSHLEIPISINSEVEEVDLDDDILRFDPDSLDFGTVPEGETHTETVTVENTGSSAVENISATSDTFDIDVESFTLEPEETEDVELAIGEPETGNIDFIAMVAGEEITETLNVQGQTIEDYSQRTDEIQERIDDIRPDVEDPDHDSELTEISGQIDQIISYWEQGDYESSQAEFESAQSSLDTVESQITAPPDDGDTSTEPDEGGLPILPVIGVLLLLVIIGAFVFYESYIPEEGDPLYGVLGE